jgi:hypothetical protein
MQMQCCQVIGHLELRIAQGHGLALYLTAVPVVVSQWASVELLMLRDFAMQDDPASPCLLAHWAVDLPGTYSMSDTGRQQEGLFKPCSRLAWPRGHFL